MLHFAYGSNMSRPLMRRRCPHAHPLGLAQLRGWQLIVTGDGYASVVPSKGASVHGVLWRLTPRDNAALNAYESVATGLYQRRILRVTADGRSLSALVYVARNGVAGRAKPGYQEILLDAAQDWQLPAHYVQDLARWTVARCHAARAPDIGEIT